MTNAMAKKLKSRIDAYRRKVKSCERSLGERTFAEGVGNFWGFVESRPYMRARLGLAMCLWDAGRREEAIGHMKDMLRLNPSDNQGVRYLLLPRLIEMGMDEEAERIFVAYEGDGSSAWMYSRALLDYRRRGDSEAARASLRAALKGNEHVPLYLQGRRKVPKALPDYYGSGDDNEAIIYAHENKGAWAASSGALVWLEATVGDKPL